MVPEPSREPEGSKEALGETAGPGMEAGRRVG